MTSERPQMPICPLCEAFTRHSARISDRTFAHCPCCDLIHVPSRDHLPPDAEKQRYLKHENSIANAGYVATFDHAIESLAIHAPHARRILDYGSGPSPVLVELLRSRGHDIVGYDPFFNIDADLECTYDAIVSVETFEHFRNPRTELTTIRRLLAPGAPLIVKTLFHRGFDSLDNWHYVRDRTHVAFYSAATFAWIADAFDLRLEQHDHRMLVCLMAPDRV